ncbi:hypothetical protein ACFYW8_33590 [Streptomyces sp. NPDC002742]|uniref:hypothetical protein n=1 Tax=Streptomyces sp. NPDC002742 TaxID=3364663 RepID=UPI0036B48D52
MIGLDAHGSAVIGEALTAVVAYEEWRRLDGEQHRGKGVGGERPRDSRDMGRPGASDK